MIKKLLLMLFLGISLSISASHDCSYDNYADFISQIDSEIDLNAIGEYINTCPQEEREMLMLFLWYYCTIHSVHDDVIIVDRILPECP